MYSKQLWKNLGFNIIFPVLMFVLLFFIAIHIIAIPELKKNLLISKREMASDLTRTAYSLVADYYERAANNELPEPEAKMRALKRIKNLRHGEDQKNYFWINNTDALMLMHPYRSDLIGTDVTDYQDPSGKFVFKEFAKIGLEKGEGYASYSWQLKDDSTKIENKVSYVKLFEPWGWIIGTGVYTNDVKIKVAQVTRNVNYTSSIILIIILIISFIIVHNSSRIESQRLLTQEKLSQSKAQYQRLIQKMNDGIILVNENEIISYINPRFSEMSGYSEKELLGKDLRDLLPSQGKKILQEQMKLRKQGKKEIYELHFNRKDHSSFETLVSPSPVLDKDGNYTGSFAVITDISKLREAEKETLKLQTELLQRRKLESLGTLAGGIAHDFNNLLTVINGHSELALIEMSEDNEIRESVSAIQSAGKKAQDLTNQLLAFSRKQMYQPRIIELNKLISNLNKMLYRLIDDDINLSLITGKEKYYIKADPAQIEQILINLVVNARDALNTSIKVTEKKQIEIGTDRFIIPQNGSAGKGLKPGDYICYWVKDNGIGVSEEIQRNIFDPFFTTKNVGKGTGLGLATVYGVVKQNLGTIQLYSKPGHGTTFKIYWPAVNEISEIAPTANKEISEETPKGNENILLVEDNEDVRVLTKTALSNYGYNVTEASNGLVALQIIKENGHKIDIIVTDLVMPEMNGKELVEETIKFMPEIKILYTSGYIDEKVIHGLDVSTEDNFIPKPYSIYNLAQKIRTILDNNFE